MAEALAVVAIVLLLVAIGMLALILVRKGSETAPLQAPLNEVLRVQQRAEQVLREEMAQSRKESSENARQSREEIANALKTWGDTTVNSIGQFGLQQAAQFDTLAKQQKSQFDTFAQQLTTLTASNETRMTELRTTVETRLTAIQTDNAAKLEQMRQTVDEKLTATLEQRLGESFKQVSERLEAVHQGLGDMQRLAAGVGDLKQVLTNVKTRGTWGEVQLGMLLEEIMTPDQYDTNVACKLGCQERVEYAVKLPGRDGGKGQEVWLPIDAKFPVEDYQRMVEAQESGDLAAFELARKALENRVKGCAKDIQSKYVDPPRTTDFGIMFLPTEGLYAEILSRPGLAGSIQNDHRVLIAGPTTLSALLNSLQMGFRILTVEQRSSEVWQLLGAVKTQFGQFGGLLEKVHKNLERASNTIDDASKKTRYIERRLSKVQELPSDAADSVLSLVEAGGDSSDNSDNGADSGDGQPELF